MHRVVFLYSVQRVLTELCSMPFAKNIAAHGIVKRAVSEELKDLGSSSYSFTVWHYARHLSSFNFLTYKLAMFALMTFVGSFQNLVP